MTRLLLATGNAHKVAEVQVILGPGFQVEARDPDVEETGTTFEDNALLKARAVAQAATDQPLDLDGAATLLALGGLPSDPLGRRARQHRVLGADPAFAAALHPAGHVLVDRRGAQHPGLTEADQARPGRHLGEVPLEGDGS